MTYRLALTVIAPALALAACDAQTDVGTAEDAREVAEAQDAPGGTGISQEALNTNSYIAELGLLARQLEQNAAGTDRAEIAGRIEGLLEEHGDDLPPELNETLRGHLATLREAIAADDTTAAAATGQAMIESLRAAAPVGGEI